jgi:hypothetical protein
MTMPESITAPPAAPAATEPPNAAAPPQSDSQTQTFNVGDYIASDGKFTDRFKEIIPEDLRGNKVYDIFSDVQGLTKYVGNAASELGKYRAGKGVMPITDKSSQQEIDAWHIAHGVPKDSTGYTWKAPEEISIEDLSPEFTKATFDEFHKNHFTPKQVESTMNMYAQHIQSIEKAVDEEMSKRVSDAENRMRGEYGDQFDAKVNLAKEFITNVSGHWDKAKYEHLFGKEAKLEDGTTARIGGINDPEYADMRVLLIDLFANIQEKYGIEDSALTPESTGQPHKSLEQQVADADKEIYENVKLRESLDHRDREKYEELIKKRDLLYKKLYPV